MRSWLALFVAVVIALGASAPALADPAHAALVQQTMKTFADGLKRDDLSALHASAGPSFRAAHTPESIRTEFAKLAALELDLGVLESLEPVFTQEQRQGEVLELAGFYPSAPLRAYFHFRYELSGSDWKLLGIGVRVTPVISASTMRHNSGWTILFEVLDPAREIFYALPGKEFRSTGHSNQRDPSTGDYLPRPTIDLPELPKSLQVKVVTRSRTLGPVTLRFDEDDALVRQAIDTLEQTRSAWALLRTFDERELLYFTHLVSYRCGIAKVRYSLGSEDLDREYVLPACNPKDPSGIPDDFEVVTVDRKYEFVAVQLDYRNGESSQLVRIPHPEPSTARSEPDPQFLVKQRSNQPQLHALLPDIERNLPAGTRLEQLDILEGVVQVRVQTSDAAATLASLKRVTALADPAPESTDPQPGEASLKFRAMVRPAPPAKTAPTPAFLTEADFDTAFAAIREGLDKLLTRQGDTQGCRLISATPYKSSDKEPYERVTLKVRLRCGDTGALIQVFDDLEETSSWFIDDARVRITSIPLGNGQSITHVDAGFDLYGYRGKPR